MSYAESQTPTGNYNERYIRRIENDEMIAYYAKFCNDCEEWMPKEGGEALIVDGIELSWRCVLHASY